MNTVEILYQIYRARYSLELVQETLDKSYRLGILATDAKSEFLLAQLGERRSPFQGAVSSKTISLKDAEPSPEPVKAMSKTAEKSRQGTIERFSLDSLEGDQLESVQQKLAQLDACIVYIDEANPDPEAVRAISRKLPRGPRIVWYCECPAAKLNPEFGSNSATPKLYSLDPEDPVPKLVELIHRTLPKLSLCLAHDYTRFRYLYSRRITRLAAKRTSVLAAASTIPAPPIPGVNLVWGLFATTGETLAITAAQLRLCMLMAAIHGRPIDFFDRIGELWPIIGSAFGWRTLAREITGLVPVAGWALKSTLAYTGTFTVGEAARLYYEHGQPSEVEVLREIKRRSKREAKKALALITEGDNDIDADVDVDTKH
jgi:uncharacterized protein (DUF697 family)